jgi:hypothetical protein
MSRAEPGCFDPFRVLDAAERQRHLQAYREFLEERDGTIDFDTCQLSRREVYFHDIEEKPVIWEGDVDHDAFHLHLHGAGAPKTDERILWLVTAAKANLIESFGVKVELGLLLAHPSRLKTADPLYLYQMMEEQYHTRILSELCRTYGILHEASPPPWPKRLAVHFMVYLPERIRWISVLTGEALGSVLFQILLESTHHFAAEPAVEARMRSLMREIWVDEVLHAAYLRAKVGRVGVWIARLLVPLVGWVMMKDLPPLEGGGTSRKVLARLRRGIAIPPGLGWFPADSSTRQATESAVRGVSI